MMEMGVLFVNDYGRSIKLDFDHTRVVKYFSWIALKWFIVFRMWWIELSILKSDFLFSINTLILTVAFKIFLP